MSQESKIINILKHIESTPIQQLQEALLNNDIYSQKIRYVAPNTTMHRKHQEDIIKLIGHNQITKFEAPPGSGKTRIAASASLNHLNTTRKPGQNGVMFVCTSKHLLNGIINKYLQYFHSNDGIYRVPGTPNSINPLNDVYFFTPRKIKDLSESQTVPPTTPTEFDQICDKCGMLIIDEAHHYPSDSQEDLALFGQIHPQLWKRFEADNKKLVSMTATHGRMDGSDVLGAERNELDRIVTAQETINNGDTPPIFGAQITMDFKVNNRWRGDLCSISFNSSEEEDKYLNSIVETIAHTYNHRPKPFCVFVGRQKRAREISKRFNSLTGLNLEVIISDVPDYKRNQIVENIESGASVGFITCNAGSESLDIPVLEVVHLVRKTRSINLLVQSIGRVMRVHPNKDSALVIDYTFAKDTIINSCVGIMDYAQYGDSQLNDTVNGGPLIVPSKEIIFDGYTVGDVRQWLGMSDMDAKKQTFVDMIKSGQPKPRENSQKKINGFVEKKLRAALDCYIQSSSKCYDEEFKLLIFSLDKEYNAGWFTRKLASEPKKQILKNLVKAGQSKPVSNSANLIDGFTEKQLYSALISYTTKRRGKSSYDEEFTKEITMLDKEHNTGWFKELSDPVKVIVSLIRSGQPKPKYTNGRKIGEFTEEALRKKLEFLLKNDAEFATMIHDLDEKYNTNWFAETETSQRRSILIDMIQSGQSIPKDKSDNTIAGFTEKQLLCTLRNSTIKSRRSYNEEFDKQIRELDNKNCAGWFDDSKEVIFELKLQILANMIKSGQPKPRRNSQEKIGKFTEHDLYSFLNCFMSNRRKRIRNKKLRDLDAEYGTDWFKPHYYNPKVALMRKKRSIIVGMIKSGQPKPRFPRKNGIKRQKIQGFFEGQLRETLEYGLKYDQEFAKMIKKLDQEYSAGWFK